MVLTALRRSAIVPDQSSTLTTSDFSYSSHPTQEGDTNNRLPIFVASLANEPAYQWTSAFDSNNTLYSSWDLNTTQTASTPRQDASIFSSQSHTSLLATSANDLLATSNIDQWLLGGDEAATPSFSPINTSRVVSLVQTESVNLQSLSLFSNSGNTQIPTSQQSHLHLFSPHHAISKDSTYKISQEIVLRSLNGESSLDIYYPQSSIVQATDDKGQAMIVTGGLMSCSQPPIEDFASNMGDKVAKIQPEKRRCDDDIYTPLWVRGEGINREGWCSLCNPGRWLNLKTSQYLYHLQNTHGVIQTSGLFCSPPLQLRVHDDSVGTTEGFCGNCQQWIAVCTVRKRRSFSAWFEHARKCRSSRCAPTLHTQHRRAVSSSPAIRLRATKKQGHQRVSSLQEMSSYIVDFADSPCSSSSIHKHEECEFADSDSIASKRLRSR